MERRFGIELEIVGISQNRAAAALRAVGITVVTPGYTHAVMASWKIVPDGSVRDGFEVVSPILVGEAGLNEAAVAIDALKAAGASASRACGLHAHLECVDLNADDIRSVVRRYAAFEAEIDAFMPPSRRGNGNHYCQSVRSLPSRPDFRNARDVRALAQAKGGRYFKVNLQSLLRYNNRVSRQRVTARLRYFSNGSPPNRTGYFRIIRLSGESTKTRPVVTSRVNFVMTTHADHQRFTTTRRH